MEEAYHQCGGGYSVQMCHSISTKEAHHQYSGECVEQCRVCMDLSQNEYRCVTCLVPWGCTVPTGNIISTVEGVQCGSVTSSVWMRVRNTRLTKLLRG